MPEPEVCLKAFLPHFRPKEFFAAAVPVQASFAKKAFAYFRSVPHFSAPLEMYSNACLRCRQVGQAVRCSAKRNFGVVSGGSTVFDSVGTEDVPAAAAADGYSADWVCSAAADGAAADTAAAAAATAAVRAEDN